MNYFSLIYNAKVPTLATLRYWNLYKTHLIDLNKLISFIYLFFIFNVLSNF